MLPGLIVLIRMKFAKLRYAKAQLVHVHAAVLRRANSHTNLAKRDTHATGSLHLEGPLRESLIAKITDTRGGPPFASVSGGMPLYTRRVERDSFGSPQHSRVASVLPGFHKEGLITWGGLPLSGGSCESYRGYCYKAFGAVRATATSPHRASIWSWPSEEGFSDDVGPRLLRASRPRTDYGRHVITWTCFGGRSTLGKVSREALLRGSSHWSVYRTVRRT